ncbi:serine/threonine-protein kinase [Jatrophihabitans fulvus]
MTEPEPPDDVWAPRAPAASPTTPELLPGYTDAVAVARGGDSVVYRARQTSVGREVAIKVVELDDSDPTAAARFRRELEITVRLGRQHPHIVTVLAVATTSAGSPCLVMDYFELGSLHDRLAARGPLPVSEVVAAGSVVADALDFAHGQGVLHRDVKPQNVLVLPTSYVLADFGLARAVDAGHSASLERFSYRHASPQILDGLPPTVADDIWSLGSTLHTLLDGRAPFAADDPDEDSALAYLRRARTGSPRPLERDDLPPALRDVVTRCLARERDDRFAGAAELRAALEAVPTETRSWAPEPAPAPPAVAPPAPPTPPPAAPAAPAAPAPPPPSFADEREPVAVSALAHLATPAHSGERPPDPPDGDATGLRPAEVPADDGDTAEPPSRRRWFLLAAIVVVALAAGVLVGVLRGGSDEPAARPRPSTGPTTSAPSSSDTRGGVVVVPSVDSRSVTPSASIPIEPSRAPRITSLKRRGTAAVLRWSDPTRGSAQFIVNFVDEPALASQIYQVQQGRTYLVMNAFPTGRHCVRVTSYGRFGGRVVAGVSSPRCLG